MSSNIASWILRVLLIIAGFTIIYTGINISFGGIATLGLQGSDNFLQVTDQNRYLAQDSHIRFLGGVWLSVGMLFVIGSINLIKYQMVLKFCFVAMFIGGLVRFSQLNIGVTLGPDVLPSLIAEIAIMPLLLVWISKICKTSK